MIIVDPIAITDAMLTSSAQEAMEPAWSASETYAGGDRVNRAHRVFESLGNANTGHDPTTSPTAWIDVGPTNRWAMFDYASTTATSGITSSAIGVQLVLPVAVDTIAFLDLVATSVRVQVAGLLDQMLPIGDATAWLLETPIPAGSTINITIVGDALRIGNLVVGTGAEVGGTQTTPKVEIIDYSKRVTDDFGITTVVPRDWAKNITCQIAIPVAEADAVTRLLASYRARPVLWITDPTAPVLAAIGFYKDFALDLTLSALSFYSLTITGLPAADIPLDDPDPAPQGESQLLMIRPLTVDPTTLTSSNAPDDGYPLWTGGVTYGDGDRVVWGQRVFDSVVSGNVGHDPAADAGTNWIDIGPTNRWAMFDQALGTSTHAPGEVVVHLQMFGAVTGLAVLDVAGATVRVQAPGYDRTQNVDAVSICFLDLNVASRAEIIVTVTAAGGAQASVGTLVLGALSPIGVTEDAPKVSLTDYSKRDTDDFGQTTVVERGWAKHMEVQSLISTSFADSVVRRMAAVRAQPSVWIAMDGLDCLTIYGFYRDFSLQLDENVSTFGLTIEGLSESGSSSGGTGLPTSVSWPDVTDPAGTKPADNADVTADNTSKDTAAVSGRPAAQVVEQLDQIQQKADDLQATYGDTASAEQSANAAEAARQAVDQASQHVDAQVQTADGLASAAAGSATVAGTKADQAGQSANAAQGYVVAAQGYASNALTFSQNSQSSAASAGASAAAAQQSATLTASIGPGYLNPNAQFVAWPDGQTTPSSWVARDYTGGAPQRVTGTNGRPYALRFVAAANANDYMSVDIEAAFGAYVIEVQGRATDWQGAGALAQFCNADFSQTLESAVLSCAATPDGSGFVNRDGGNGAYTRTFSLFYKTATNGTIRRIRLHAMGNWDGFGERAAKTVTFDRVSIRPATQPEIDAGKALTNASTALAQISSFQATQVSQNNAFAQSINGLTTRVGAAESGIQSAQQSAANASSAAAQVSNTLAAAIRPGNVANLLRNGDAKDGLNNWNQIGPAGSWSAHTYPTVGTYFSHNVNAPSPGPHYLYQDVSIGGPGTVLGLSFEGGYGSDAFVFVDWLNADRSQGLGRAITLQPGPAGWDSPSRWAGTSGPAPSGAYWARVHIYVNNANSYCDLTRIMLQTGAPTAWRDDASLAEMRATVTQQAGVVADITNNLLRAYWQVLVDVGGSGKAGVILAAKKQDGTTTSNIDMYATSISFWNPQLGAPNNPNAYVKALSVENGNVVIANDLRGGAGRIIFDNGTFMKVIGTGFGNSNQFIEWAGPSRDPSQCDEASAVSYLKVDGSGYFGGSLSAGSNKNAQQTTNTSATASITTDQWGSRGGTRHVTFSYSWLHSRTVNVGGGGSASGTTSATLSLFRNGAFLQNLTVSGNADVSPATGSDPGFVRETMGGSVTINDTAGGTSVNYTATLNARSIATFGGSSSQADIIQQTISILETEQ